MTDVRKIQSTSGIPDPSPKKEATPAEPDKFKDLMKVDKIDPEEQKKRKRREGEETEEDVLAESLMLESLLQPQTPVTESTQTLTITPKSLQETPLPPSTTPLPSETPHAPEEEIQPEDLHKTTTPRMQTKSAADKTQAKPQVHPEEIHEEPPPSHLLEPGSPKEPFSIPAPIKEASSPIPYLHMPKSTEKKEEKKPEPIEEAPSELPIAPIAPPPTLTSTKKEEKKLEPIEASVAPLPPSQLPQALPPPPPPPSHTQLPHEVFTLFQKAVDVITVMTLTGVKETTIRLEGPQFASSVFFGSEIIIQEFSTAPGSFNIQLLGTQASTTLFDKHMDSLMRTFQTGEYNFRVNRLESRLKSTSTEEPLFKRKESIGNDSTKEGPL